MSELTPAKLRAAAGWVGMFVIDSWCDTDEERAHVAAHVADLVASLREAADELDGRTQPTRDQIAEVIEKALREHARAQAIGYYRRDCLPAADAVLALFGVAVSDSQETPTEGREE